MKRVSYVHCVAMELKRGVRERQLLIFMIIMLAYWIGVAVLRVAGAMQLYAYSTTGGGCEITFLDIQYQTKNMMSDDLFMYYLPFVAAAVYAFSIVDDRMTGFSEQIYGKMGFFHYYAGKLTASAIMGGCVCAVQMFIVFLITFLTFGINPFIKSTMAADGSTSVATTTFAAYGFSDIYAELSFAQWILMGVIQLLLAGIFYGLLAGLIAFFMNNKLLVYIVPMFLPQVFDKVIYLIGLPLRDSAESAYDILSNFTLRFSVSDLGTAYTTAVGILCLTFICLLCGSVLEKRYVEGGR